MYYLKMIAIGFLLLFAGCKATQTNGGNQACIDPKKINPNQICTEQYEPVCGCDNRTYGNACDAERAGLTRWTVGECKK
jgi:hypothetical protein